MCLRRYVEESNSNHDIAEIRNYILRVFASNDFAQGEGIWSYVV